MASVSIELALDHDFYGVNRVASKYFLFQNNRTIGPFDLDQLIGLKNAGTLSPDILTWAEGDADWLPLGERLVALFFVPPIPGTDDAAVPTRTTQTQSSLVSESLGPFRRPFTSNPDTAIMNYRSASAAPSHTPAIQTSTGWTDLTPHPWRRNFARQIDNLVGGFFGCFVLGTVLFVASPKYLDGFLSLIQFPGGFIEVMIFDYIAIFPNAIMIGFTGGNLGKWLMGVKIVDSDYCPIGPAKAFQRELRVWMSGLGMGIPIISLITIFMSYQTLMSSGSTKYDRNLSTVVVHRANSWIQVAGWILAISLLMILIAGFRALSLLPHASQ